MSRPLKLGAQAIAVAGVAALLAILVWRLTHRPASPKIGGPAPTFSLARLDGRGAIDLADLRGHAVVLNFWASWCGPCKREAPALERFWHEYRSRGVLFIGIDSNDGASDARRFVRAHGITYPVVRDAQGLVAANRYNVADLPVTYFVDKRGRLVEQPVLGPVSDSAFAKAFRRGLDEALGS
jgi:cytochrome c biogenesis protein CcmG, thiol:disulfide interchange protein DsbE